MLEFHEYDPSNKEGLVLRLRQVWFNLAKANEALADALIMEQQDRLEGIGFSRETTVSGQNRDADTHSHAARIEVIRQRGEVAMLTVEKEFLLYLLGLTSDSE